MPEGAPAAPRPQAPTRVKLHWEKKKFNKNSGTQVCFASSIRFALHCAFGSMELLKLGLADIMRWKYFIFIKLHKCSSFQVMTKDLFNQIVFVYQVQVILVKRAFIYESSGKTVCRNVVEVVGGVH